MKRLETERMILRPWRMEDAADLYAYAKDPSVGPAAGWKPHDSVEESQEYLSKAIAENDTLAMELKEDGHVIGALGLHDHSHGHVAVHELGYVMNAAYWGRGLMTEAALCVLNYAFEELQLPIVTVGHFRGNDRSRRVIEKCGFHFDGVRRMAFERYDGVVFDEFFYSITAEEWKKGARPLAAGWRFYQNPRCAYFPCHKTDTPERFSCQFCYCPLYLLGKNCGGNFRILNNGVKDCSNCLIPHYEYDRILARLSQEE